MRDRPYRTAPSVCAGGFEAGCLPRGRPTTPISFLRGVAMAYFFQPTLMGGTYLDSSRARLHELVVRRGAAVRVGLFGSQPGGAPLELRVYRGASWVSQPSVRLLRE